MHTCLTFRTTLSEPSLNTKEFCIVKAMTMKEDREDISNPLPDPFFYKQNETAKWT